MINDLAIIICVCCLCILASFVLGVELGYKMGMEDHD